MSVVVLMIGNISMLEILQSISQWELTNAVHSLSCDLLQAYAANKTGYQLLRFRRAWPGDEETEGCGVGEE